MPSTERTREERDESRLRLQGLFEAAPDPILIVDADGVIIEANGEAGRAFGFPLDDLLGQPIETLIPQPHRAAHAKQRRAYIERPERRPMGRGLDLVARRRDGSSFPVDITLGPFETPSGRWVVAIVRDMTEQRAVKAELSRRATALDKTRRELKRHNARLLEANAELEAFAYSVSHDLRTPLRGMEGIARALEEDFGDRLPPLGQDYVRRIVAAAERMDGLILDLLLYSRLARNRATPRAVDLDPIWTAARGELDERLQPCVRLKTPLGRVRGNAAMLQQVAANLLGNAVKFVPAGVEPAVEVRSVSSESDVRVFVRDNGIGIQPEHHARIFGIFERLHGVEQYPGSGIGLALVKKAVESLGGSLGVESSPDDGSCFWFQLPRAGEQ